MDQSAILFAPNGLVSVSFRGQTYEVVDGLIEVPVDAVEELLGHGFLTDEPPATKTEIEEATADVVQKRRGRPRKIEITEGSSDA